MGKNITVFLLFGLILVCTTNGIYSVEAQHTQDGQGFPLAGPLNISSPSNSTYSSRMLFLKVTSKFLLTPNFASFSYSLDGAENVTLPVEGTLFPIEVIRTYANGTTEKGISIFSYHILTGYADLTRLSDGSHNITVFAEYHANDWIGFDDSTVCFTVAENSSSPTAITDNFQNSVYDNGSAVVNENFPSSAPSAQSSLESETTDLVEPPLGAIKIVVVSVVLTFGIAIVSVVCLKKRKSRKDNSTNSLLQVF